MKSRIQFKPSDEARWSTCSASVFDSVGVQVEEKEYSKEGDSAHKLFELTATEVFIEDVNCSAHDFLNDNVPELAKYSFNEEMADAVDEAISYIADNIPVGWKVYLEKRVDLGWLYKGQSGRADLIAYNQQKTEFLSVDFKYGKGLLVQAKDNGEILLHLGGFINQEMTAAKAQKIKSIKIMIAQPRRNNYPIWNISYSYLQNFCLSRINIVKDIVSKGEKGKVYNPSPSACQFCPKNRVDGKSSGTRCIKLREKIMDIVIESKDPLGGFNFTDIQLKENEELSELWEWLDFIVAWCNNLKNYMQEKAIAFGDIYPDLELHEGGLSDRKFTSEKKVLSKLQRMGYNEDEIFERKLKSPSKIEKLLGKTKFKRLSGLVNRETRRPKLGKKGTGTPVAQALADEFEDLI